MKKNSGRLTGILGTVIIHLIAAIIFMSVQIRALKIRYNREFEMELAPDEPPQTKPKTKELPATSVERVLSGDNEMLNIARNMANKSDVKINREDYIDKVKEELIKSGKLGKDNYIDEQKKINANNSEQVTENETVPLKTEKDENPSESAKLAANYKGPTRIYYNLPGRNHLYLPIPIYKCQGSGSVVMYIDVNQKGIVEKATVIPEESSTSEPCLIEAAVNSALISRFNSDVNSPNIQRGTLSFRFVAQ